MSDKNCITCKKRISLKAIFCKSCSNKNRKGKYHLSIKAIEKKTGINSPVWKENLVQYKALHAWVRRHKNKSLCCECCGKFTNKLDLANTSGLYKRDILDYKWTCRKCHITNDGRIIKNLILFKKGMIPWNKGTKGLMLINLNKKLKIGDKNNVN